MAKAILDIERLRSLLAYDPETGVFIWLVNRGPNKMTGKIAGSPDEEGYVRIGIDRRRYRAHRLAWFYVHGEWPALELDHKDTDRTNNRIDNLRQVTRTVNMQNMRKSPAKASDLPMGVCRDRRGFYSQISLYGKKTYLGTFPTPEAAHEAYVSAKRLHHEGCTL